MEHLMVERYMKLIEPLPFEVKLELVSRIIEQLKSHSHTSKVNKDQLLEELHGAWEDIDDSILEDIFMRRTTSEKEITLD